jgi:hypothetical protein
LFKVEDSNGNLSSQATFTINVGVQISSAKGANKSVVYPDTNGQQVTVALSKGVADVYFDGYGTESAAKGVVTITGTHLTISNIAASQTTASSALTLKTKHNAGLITLGGVTDAGTLGSITGTSTNLVGVTGSPTIVVGGVRSINLKSITSSEIQAGNAGVTAVSLVTGAVTDSFFTSTGTVSSLKAASWTNTIADLATEAITAPVIKSLNVAAEAKLVYSRAKAGDILGLPEGAYHIVSTYLDSSAAGKAVGASNAIVTNSIVSADIKVPSGKVLDVTLRHRYATLTLKLVNAAGAEALANTNFTILTPGGDLIRELIGAFPSLVLAEGEYVVIARHDSKTYQSTFEVQSGLDRDVEIVAQ